MNEGLKLISDKERKSKLGAVLPRELTFNPTEIVNFAEEAEQLGYDFVVAYDHVILPEKDLLRKDAGFYHHTFTNEDPYTESLTLLSAVAAKTEKVGLFTGVLVSPQRQTVLLAKQAAMVDLMSKGRLVLGVGVGWNPGEYHALGKSFETRGKEMDRQIPLLRKLWTDSSVVYQAGDESIDREGIYPLPIQQPIPIWIGGQTNPVIRRAARTLDGWIPMEFKPDEFDERMGKMREELEKNGREMKDFGIMGKINPTKERDVYKKQLDQWKRHEVSHLVLSTNYAGPKLNDHLGLLRKFRNVLES